MSTEYLAPPSRIRYRLNNDESNVVERKIELAIARNHHKQLENIVSIDFSGSGENINSRRLIVESRDVRDDEELVLVIMKSEGGITSSFFKRLSGEGTVSVFNNYTINSASLSTNDFL